MAKLITKFKYIKPGNGAGSYLKYIATREGVEKIDDSKKLLPTTAKQKILIAKLLRDFPDSREMLEYEDYRAEKTIGAASEFITRAIEDNAHSMMTSKTYADYIATRPRAERFGSHGLFTDDGVEIKLTEVSEELNRHEGNVWTAIVSLRREDAERLGFNRGARWRDMLRTQTQALSENLKIPMENLRWYAAFHNESHHPHVHLIAYSLLENEGYLTKKGVENLRSSFARDIFAQDLLSVYEQQTEHRDALRAEGKKLAEEIAAGIHAGSYDNPVLENKLTELAGRLARTGGKKVYGYLKADVKDLIDNIVDELAKDERIASLYSLWYEKREEVLKTYTMDMPARLPLSRNPEFKPIRNAVIQAAMEIMADRVMEDGAADEGAELSGPEAFAEPERSESEPVEADIPFPTGGGSRRKKTWWTDKYKTARSYLYGTKDVPPNFKKAFEGMQEEAASGNGLAMYDLGRMHLSGRAARKTKTLHRNGLQKRIRHFWQRRAEPKSRDICSTASASCSPLDTAWNRTIYRRQRGTKRLSPMKIPLRHMRLRASTAGARGWNRTTRKPFDCTPWRPLMRTAPMPMQHTSWAGCIKTASVRLPTKLPLNPGTERHTWAFSPSSARWQMISSTTGWGR